MMMSMAALGVVCGSVETFDGILLVWIPSNHRPGQAMHRIAKSRDKDRTQSGAACDHTALETLGPG